MSAFSIVNTLHTKTCLDLVCGMELGHNRRSVPSARVHVLKMMLSRPLASSQNVLLVLPLALKTLARCLESPAT